MGASQLGSRRGEHEEGLLVDLEQRPDLDVGLRRVSGG
jgi:hypothetical protein